MPFRAAFESTQGKTLLLCFSLSAPSKCASSGPPRPARVLALFENHRPGFASTTAREAVSSARPVGHPTPELRWLALDDTGVVPGTPALDLSGLRRVRADGSLEFLPFRADEYRQDVHSATYRCLASNRIGVIGSRDVHVRAGECSFFG
ncbi:hypothetical protein MRX96_036895 [Rhipicephalus microplus]